MDMTVTLERLKRWGTKGGLGILDQGLYSGVNFILSVVLARWISPEAYGGFSAAFSLFLLLSTAQVALIAEPMSIFGADQYRQNAASYLDHLLRIQWIGSLFACGLVLLFALFVPIEALRQPTMAMAAALPLILHFWYLRRAFYIDMQSGMAMLTSFVYSVLIILTLLFLQAVGRLTASTAYVALALSSLGAALFPLNRLRLHMFGKRADAVELNPHKINEELWSFGKWILPAYIAGWLTSFSFPFFITILVNAQSAGAFRAIQNLFLPLQQLLAAITLLVLPWLARQKSEQGSAKLFAVTHMAAAMTGFAALVYCSLIVIFRREIVAFLYASDFYSLFDNLTVFLALSTLAGSAPLILGLTLRVVGQPNIILWSKGGAAIFFLGLGILMIWLFQINGVVFALLGTSTIEVFLLLFFYLRVKRVAMQVSHPDTFTGLME